MELIDNIWQQKDNGTNDHKEENKKNKHEDADGINIETKNGPSKTFTSRHVPRYSISKSKIFKPKDKLEDMPSCYHILSDRGYPCLRYLLTPVANPQSQAEL
uniref:DDE Tnp4 domain-containing protein n=1 Tax=Romanomermis culicivorax TaxID=13658 RepID=A0A915L7L2_ROMCU